MNCSVTKFESVYVVNAIPSVLVTSFTLLAILLETFPLNVTTPVNVALLTTVYATNVFLMLGLTVYFVSQLRTCVKGTPLWKTVVVQAWTTVFALLVTIALLLLRLYRFTKQ